MRHSRHWLFSLPLSRRTYAAAAKRNTDSNHGNYEASRQAQQARYGSAVVCMEPLPCSDALETSNMPLAALVQAVNDKHSTLEAGTSIRLVLALSLWPVVWLHTCAPSCPLPTATVLPSCSSAEYILTC